MTTSHRNSSNSSGCGKDRNGSKARHGRFSNITNNNSDCRNGGQSGRNGGSNTSNARNRSHSNIQGKGSNSSNARNRSHSNIQGKGSNSSNARNRSHSNIQGKGSNSSNDSGGGCHPPYPTGPAREFLSREFPYKVALNL
jgi:hypothetical protein